MTNLATQTHDALFEAAFAICGDGVADFPREIEAELDALCGVHGWLQQWDAYCQMRDAVQNNETAAAIIRTRCRPINDTVTDELVEAVAEALLSAFLAGRGSITARERNAHKPEPEMGHFRSVARATLANEATQ